MKIKEGTILVAKQNWEGITIGKEYSNFKDHEYNNMFSVIDDDGEENGFSINKNSAFYWRAFFYVKGDIEPFEQPQQPKNKDWFNEAFLKENNFKLIRDDGKYGYAESIKPNGYVTLEFNRGGIGLSYLGDKLEPNIAIGLKLDGGTRTAFNGIIYSEEDFITVLKLIR